MPWVISGSFGPTDPTRAMLPFLFAASTVQAGRGSWRLARPTATKRSLGTPT
jgi:hypothetical protein